MRRLIPLLLSAAFLTLLAAPADAATGDLLKVWGEPGTKKGELGNIYGLALDHKGRVWVADTSNDRVQRFSRGGVFQRKIDGNLLSPEGIAVGPDKKIYVTDSGHDRIKVFGPGGNLKRKWGGLGSGDGEFEFPASVAVAPNGKVYVADRDNDRVQKFGPSGNFRASFDAGLDLDGPNGVAYDPSENTLYVADSQDDRIVKIDTHGALLDEWPIMDGGGTRPSMLAAGNGFVYVTLGIGDRAQKYDTDGNFVDEWGQEGSAPGDMNSPCGIVLTPNGKRVYVAEFLNHRVQRFES